MALVAARDVPFEDLDRQLEDLDWFLESESQQPPLIPGEPELCVYAHRQIRAQLTYTFNPVVGLRVLAFDGHDAVIAEVAVAKRIALIDEPAIKTLLSSADKRDVLLGLWSAGVIKAWSVRGEVQRLTKDRDSEIGRAATQISEQLSPPATRLQHHKTPVAPDRAALFKHLGSVEMRRQTLRWLAHDFTQLTPAIEEMLRAGLNDEDEEVRMTAKLVGERLRRGDAPTPVRPTDDRALLTHSLTTPLYPAPPPEELPSAVEPDGEGGYRLCRSGVGLCWVAPVAHWLGAGNRIRTVKSPGFFIAREPMTAVLADWCLAPAQGPLGTARSHGARTHLCTHADALALASALGRLERTDIALPTPEQWEMAARGTDGRRYPWGNREDLLEKQSLSPWGCARMVGGPPEWTADDMICGGPRAIPCAQTRPASDVSHAAVRIVVAPVAATQ